MGTHYHTITEDDCHKTLIQYESLKHIVI